jgi:dTDP-D-glucose 4,6-dehydratase
VALVAGGCGFIGSNFINYMFDVWPTTMFINVDKLILNSDVTYVDPHVATCVDRYKLVTSDIRNHECIAALLEQHQVPRYFGSWWNPS